MASNISINGGCSRTEIQFSVCVLICKHTPLNRYGYFYFSFCHLGADLLSNSY